MIVVVSALAIVITAAYVLRVTGQVFFGEFDEEKYPEVGDIGVTDRVILLLLGLHANYTGYVSGNYGADDYIGCPTGTCQFWEECNCDRI